MNRNRALRFDALESKLSLSSYYLYSPDLPPTLTLSPPENPYPTSYPTITDGPALTLEQIEANEHFWDGIENLRRQAVSGITVAPYEAPAPVVSPMVDPAWYQQYLDAIDRTIQAISPPYHPIMITP